MGGLPRAAVRPGAASRRPPERPSDEAAERRPKRRPAERPPERPIVVALPKGRVLGAAIELFRQAGYDLGPVQEETRRLVHDCGPIRALVLRSGDVPTYVEYGAADVGVAGRDVLEEEERDLYEPLDLRIGACRLMLAEPVDRPVDLSSHMHLRVATKYPVLTRRYLEERGVAAEVIKLSGSVELGPLTGLADRIVDLVETGETLRQNGLVEVETILDVTSRLVVNPASLKLRGPLVAGLIERLAAAVEARRDL